MYCYDFIQSTIKVESSTIKVLFFLYHYENSASSMNFTLEIHLPINNTRAKSIEWIQRSAFRFFPRTSTKVGECAQSALSQVCKKKKKNPLRIRGTLATRVLESYFVDDFVLLPSFMFASCIKSESPTTTKLEIPRIKMLDHKKMYSILKLASSICVKIFRYV